MRGILILLLALWAAASWTQPPGAQSPAAREPGVEAPDAQEPAPSPGDSASGEEPPPAGDPFDYEASEQISEDLSVSFPVDI